MFIVGFEKTAVSKELYNKAVKRVLSGANKADVKLRILAGNGRSKIKKLKSFVESKASGLAHKNMNLRGNVLKGLEAK